MKITKPRERIALSNDGYHTVPAEGVCGCGRAIVLRYYTNTCPCGVVYNIIGQLSGGTAR